MLDKLLTCSYNKLKQLQKRSLIIRRRYPMQQRYKPMLNLKLMRVRRGLTLEALAKKTGLNYNTINQYEKGYHHPKLESLKKIAEALECELEEIV